MWKRKRDWKDSHPIATYQNPLMNHHQIQLQPNSSADVVFASSNGMRFRSTGLKPLADLRVVWRERDNVGTRVPLVGAKNWFEFALD